jgi:two-component system phosphate regulon sensor histidine kinase PhoR
MTTVLKSMEDDFQKALDFPFNKIYIHESAKILGDNLHSRVTILNYKKKLILEYIPESVKAELKRNPDFLIKQSYLSNLEFPDSLSYIKHNGEHISIFPIHYEDRILGYVLTDMPLNLVYDPWYNFSIQIIQITAILFIIAFIIFTILSQNIVYPIKQLITITKKIGKGDLNIHSIAQNDNELGQLSIQMQDMATKLKDSFELISKQKETLDTMINSIQQALWIVNSHGIILIANQQFKEITNNNNPDAKYIWEVLRHPKMSSLIKQIIEERKNFTIELDYNEKLYLCSTTYMPSSQQIIFSLLEITQIREMEKLKRDFVSNVSHELRTPLTAIKGFIETLSEDASEEQLQYIKVIERNTERLINIVKDLLMLSKLEQIQTIESEIVNLPELLDNILPLFKDKLNEKDMQLKIDTVDEIPEIQGDSFKLEQVFINLIDNAIKYAGKGKISIILDNLDTMIRIRVKDEGDGIPKQHLGRIFERFYVTDTSRSRKMGGTGLGLSIVKHIIHLHNGKIQVQSEEGEGTTFTIFLPVRQAKE